jgi:hypothetical protein
MTMVRQELTVRASVTYEPHVRFGVIGGCSKQAARATHLLFAPAVMFGSRTGPNTSGSSGSSITTSGRTSASDCTSLRACSAAR